MKSATGGIKQRPRVTREREIHAIAGAQRRILGKIDCEANDARHAVRCPALPGPGARNSRAEHETGSNAADRWRETAASRERHSAAAATLARRRRQCG